MQDINLSLFPAYQENPAINTSRYNIKSHCQAANGEETNVANKRNNQRRIMIVVIKVAIQL